MRSRIINDTKTAFRFARHWFNVKLLNKEIPLMGGLVINEKCNLHCLQCDVSNRPGFADLSFGEISLGLDSLLAKGIRNVYLEGGEPFLWKQGDKNLEDIIKLARGKGFQTISIYTNGTLSLNSSADTVFVSIDGLKNTNNYLRGNGRNVYDRVIRNINNSSHPNIIINSTINSVNKAELEAFCRTMDEIPNIKGVFFNFHTPYYGIDDLFIPKEEKIALTRQIIRLKRAGFKIANSFAGLQSYEKDTWKRPSSNCYIYANNNMYKCCRSIGNDEACANCGYMGFAEIENVLNLRPSALWEARRYV